MTNLQKIQLSISENALSISEIEQRLKPFSGYEGPPGYEGPAGPFLGKEAEALLAKRTALLTKQTGLERMRAALEARLADERNRTQKARLPGEDRASYLITVISEAYLVPVSAFLSKPSTALIL